MSLEFEKLFKIPLLAQRVNRSYPYLERNVKWYIQTGIMYSYFTMVFCLILYNLIYYDIRKRDFSQICKDAIILLVYLVVSFQYYVLLYHRENIKLIIDCMKKDYELSKSFNKKEQAIITKYANQGAFVCKVWLMISISGASTFVVKSIFLMIYYYFKNEFRLVPYYELVYPAIIEEKKDKIYIFLLTYSIIALYAYYAAVMYSAFVPLGQIMMLHASGQLELIRARIDNLYGELDNAIINEKLRSIIKQLQYIYGFVDITKNIFEVAYELTLKAAVIMLPVTLYEVLEAKNRGEFSLEFMTFIIGSILIASSPCYYSDLLMQKGEDVRLALYTCGWERHYECRQRSNLQMLLLYALRPIALRSIFRTLCLDTLTDLIHQAYAIFNLMNVALK